MTRRGLGVLGVVTLCAALSRSVFAADWLAGGVSISISGFTVESPGWVDYQCGCFTGLGSFSGSHVLNDGGTGTVASGSFSGSEQSSYSGTLSAGTIYSHCYQATLSASGIYGASNGYASGTVCAPAQPAPPPPPVDRCESWPGSWECSPIVLQLDNRPYDLTGTEDTVLFDINADGAPDRVTWTALNSAVAFLAMDRNGNGRIDGGAELFGNATRLGTGEVAANGFEALKELDSDRSGAIDHGDAAWRSLVLWRDANHDGVSQQHEISVVAGSDITAIETDYHWSGKRDPNGNFYRYESLVHMDHVVRPVYDVFLHIVH